MKTIEFLNQYGIEALTEQYAIKVNQWEDLYVLNYCQIDSPKTHDITKECRSLVVTQQNDKWVVVSRSFDRFFNYGEAGTEQYKIEDLIAYEKLDGSLIGLFFWKDQWLFRTRSMIMPETSVNGFDTTWSELFDQAAFNTGLDKKTHLFDWNCTYIFELTSPVNRVVTRYTEPKLTLLAIRQNKKGTYIYSGTDFRDVRPKHYHFSNLHECLKAAKELRNLEEGYVLYTAQGEPAMKVKNPAYVAAHHLRGEGLNPKRVAELVAMNETAEYLAIFPEDEPTFTPVIEKYNRIKESITELWNTFRTLESQKEFALAVKDYPGSGILFNARKTGVLNFEEKVMMNLLVEK